MGEVNNRIFVKTERRSTVIQKDSLCSGSNTIWSDSSWRVALFLCDSATQVLPLLLYHPKGSSPPWHNSVGTHYCSFILILRNTAREKQKGIYFLGHLEVAYIIPFLFFYQPNLIGRVSFQEDQFIDLKLMIICSNNI